MTSEKCEHPDPTTLTWLICRNCGYWHNGVRHEGFTIERLREVLNMAADSAQPLCAWSPLEYSVELIDNFLETVCGASFPANSDEEAEDEARALAVMHAGVGRTLVRARLHCKGRPDVWWIDL